MLAFLTGLVAGAAHVVTGPDHLAALAPIAAHRPKQARQLGLRWGLGHGAGVLILGAIGIFAKQYIDIQLLSSWSELLVGFVLIVVGLWAFRKASKLIIHSHSHDHHGESEQAHAHFHIHDSARSHDGPDAHRGHSHAAFMVGALHGAAGTGHLFGVVPSLAFPALEASIYLAAYFLSAVAAMTAFGGLIGLVSRRGTPQIIRKVMYGTSSCAIVIGGVWIAMAWPA